MKVRNLKRQEVAGSRVDYSPTTTSTWQIARAATFYEINHMPKKGITSKEIAKKYNLGEMWYEYEGDSRRVNMSEQLVRNELNKYFKERKLRKLWSPKTGRLVKRAGYVVYVEPGVAPDREVEYGIPLPDRKKWGFE